MDGIDMNALGSGDGETGPSGAPAAATSLGVWLRSTRTINWILFALVCLDITLTTFAVAFPDTWFHVMHGIPYADHDPAGLLRRTGAMWFAFTLVQVAALLGWQQRPYLLAMVAGVRSTEVFSDWTTLVVAQVTPFARVALFTSPLVNILLVVLLLAKYRQLQPRRLRDGAAPTQHG